jgi:hypothetical protein
MVVPELVIVGQEPGGAGLKNCREAALRVALVPGRQVLVQQAGRQAADVARHDLPHGVVEIYLIADQ